MNSNSTLDSARARLEAGAPEALRRGFEVVGSRRIGDGWDIFLHGPGLELRLELTPVTRSHAAMVRVAFRPSPDRPAGALARVLGRWTPLMTERLPREPTPGEASTMLAAIRSRLVGDPRSERLLRA